MNHKDTEAQRPEKTKLLKLVLCASVSLWFNPAFVPPIAASPR